MPGFAGSALQIASAPVVPKRTPFVAVVVIKVLFSPASKLVTLTLEGVFPLYLKSALVAEVLSILKV
jgi:hypothetical protein